MMKTFTTIILFMLLWVDVAVAGTMQETTDKIGPFEVLHIYQTTSQPKHIVLFISAEGGWNSDAINMARSLATLDSLVVGIDLTSYIQKLNASSSRCSYPAAHFEELSQYLQKKYNYAKYTQPVLVGYAAGATLVYAILAQSPANTFAGGIGMAFCPDLKTAYPLCSGTGTLSSKPDSRLGFIYNPVATLASRLYVLQSDINQACSSPDIKMFLEKVSNAEFIQLPKVDNGLSVQNNWMPQYTDVFQKIIDLQQQQLLKTLAVEVNDLPLVELRVKDSHTLAVIVSGDGGWAGIDKQVAEALNKNNINVIGLDSLQYFWKKKDPDIAGKDLARILEHYINAWEADKLILIGYSTGADTLPFMINRLPDNLKSAVNTVALLGLGKEANFEFHVSDWLLTSSGVYKVIPEAQKLKNMNVLCIYGDEETDSGCLELSKKDFNVIGMTGGHHFGGGYEHLAKTILKFTR